MTAPWVTAWAWLKRSWKWIVGLVVGLLVLVIGGTLVARKVGKLRDEAQLEAAQREIARLELERAAVERAQAQTEEQRRVKDVRARAIDRELLHHRRLAVSAFEGGEELTDREIEQAYREVTGG